MDWSHQMGIIGLAMLELKGISEFSPFFELEGGEGKP